MALGMAGPSTIFASMLFHCAPKTADPSGVIRSTTLTGTSEGGICGRGGAGAAAEGVCACAAECFATIAPIEHTATSTVHVTRRIRTWLRIFRSSEIRFPSEIRVLENPAFAWLQLACRVASEHTPDPPAWWMILRDAHEPRNQSLSRSGQPNLSTRGGSGTALVPKLMLDEARFKGQNYRPEVVGLQTTHPVKQALCGGSRRGRPVEMEITVWH